MTDGLFATFAMTHVGPLVENPVSAKAASVPTAAVKLCLDRTGVPSSVELIDSSGYPEYDRKLIAEIRRWRYRPYEVENAGAVAVCTAVVFRYEMK